MDTPPIALQDFLAPDAVSIGLETSGKKALLQTMAEGAATALGLEAHAIFDVLWERERLGSTGVGHGIAIPHARVSGLENVRGFMVRLGEPIDFEAVDGRPVDLVFLLLAPEHAGADHLHALAVVSRLLRNAALVQALRQAKDAASLYKALTTASSAQAA